MPDSAIDKLARKIDAHLDKTGTVLVGMHHELQEQKRRVALSQAAVDALNTKADETVADLRARAEAAVLELNQAESLVLRVRHLAQQADEALKIADASFAAANEKLAGQSTRFQLDATDFIGAATKEFEVTIHAARVGFSSAVGELASANKSAANDAKVSFAEAIDQLRAQVEAQIGADQRFIDSIKEEFEATTAKLAAGTEAAVGGAQKAFSEALAESDQKLSSHLDVHQRFLRSAHGELEQRQQKSDQLFATLSQSIEAHQLREANFARNTRTILIGAVVVLIGIAVYISVRLV